MTFLTPAFLTALALVGIPILIHLIRRRKLKIVPWAAMEFLLQSQKKQRRRLRIEEIILLLLRMLIVGLAVFAFARPVLRALGIDLLSQNTRVYAIILLDNSYSMGAKGSDGKTSLERGKEAATQLIQKILRDGDSVSILVVSDKVEPIVESPSFDRRFAAKRLETIKLSDRSTNYLVGTQAALRLLRASKAPVKEVYWVTDDQKDAWESSKRDSAKATWRELSRLARTHWVSVGSPANERENLEIEPPTPSSELVTPQLATRLETRIVNYGTKPRRNLLVNLMIDGAIKGSTKVSLEPGAASTISFLHQFVRPGTHTGSITLSDAENSDTLARDNSAPFVVRVREKIRVLTIDPKPNQNPSQSESYFLLKAMAPDELAGSFASKLRETSRLDGVNLRDYDVVLVTGLISMASEDRRALTDFVRAGGGLWLFPGPTTDAGRINSEWGDLNLLPAKLNPQKRLDLNSGAKLDPNSIQHPALGMFKDTSSMNLAGAQFFVYHPLEPAADKDASAVRVMLRFNSGDPALVERQVGLGHVVLSASSAGRLWNDLPLQSAYLPFTYQVLFYLGQGATSHRNLRLDEPLFLSLALTDAEKAVRVTSPSGQTSTQNPVLDARGVTFRYDKTGQAGVYKLAVAGSRTTDSFAVGLAAGESNLTIADPRTSAQESGVMMNAFSVAKSPTELPTLISRSRYGTEIWYPIVVAIICLLFLESFLAQKFGRRG